jgi:hypothetical protein
MISKHVQLPRGQVTNWLRGFPFRPTGLPDQRGVVDGVEKRRPGIMPEMFWSVARTQTTVIPRHTS